MKQEMNRALGLAGGLMSAIFLTGALTSLSANAEDRLITQSFLTEQGGYEMAIPHIGRVNLLNVEAKEYPERECAVSEEGLIEVIQQGVRQGSIELTSGGSLLVGLEAKVKRNGQVVCKKEGRSCFAKLDVIELAPSSEDLGLELGM